MRFSMLYLFAATALLVSSCASSSPFTRRNVSDPEAIVGTFTLHLMQDSGGYLASRAAVLDREGDSIEMIPAVSRYDLRTLRGVTLPEAIEVARDAFATHCAYSGYLVRDLTTSDGTLAGLEVIPEYTMFMCETAPMVSLNYFDKGQGRIRVSLQIIGGATDDNLLRIRPRLPSK